MRYAIVGGSAAAVSAVEAIRSVDKTSQIDLFSDEKTPLFSRVLLPYYIAEELTKQLLNFRTSDFFAENDVTPHVGVKVQEVSPDSRSLRADDGNKYEFDRLLLATGGRPIVPRIPGVEKKGVSTLKYMEDAEKIYQSKGKRAVIIGAGSVGVEASISLKRKGLKVTMVEQLGQVLPTVFDEESATIVRKVLEEKGVEVVTGERVLKLNGNGSIRSVDIDKGEIKCDMVIMAVGVRPEVELAKTAGIEIGPLGGIKTDSQMMTNCPGIYAAGDVSETYDIAHETSSINAIWPMAVEQGHIAGLNMAGKETRYDGSLRMNSIGNFIGFPAVSMGMVRAENEKAGLEAGEEFQEVKRKTKNSYRKLILKNGQITGAILIGETQKAGIISTLLKKKIDISAYIPALMSSSLNFVDLLPLIRRNADRFEEIEYKRLMDSGI